MIGNLREFAPKFVEYLKVLRSTCQSSRRHRTIGVAEESEMFHWLISSFPFLALPLCFGPSVLEPDLHVVRTDGRIVLPIGHRIQIVGVLQGNCVRLQKALCYLLNLEPTRMWILFEPSLQNGQFAQRVKHESGSGLIVVVAIVAVLGGIDTLRWWGEAWFMLDHWTSGSN